MILAELKRETSLEKAHESPKMVVVKQRIGEENLHKLLCFILKDFQDSLKITNPANEMSASEIFEAADRLMGTREGEYGYESVFDIIMAFKHFKANPFELFNAFSDIKLTKIITNYLELKADFLEKLNRQPGRDAQKKEPLTLDLIRSEYALSQAGQPTQGDAINQQRRQEDLKRPANWRQDEAYRKVLASRDWSKGYQAEDTSYEDVTDN
ncbi:hypothetical protein GGR92_000016 [Spirosoma lacussanchae]|uniref:hypothetical protein n=1 Tax=Spirosoma lacussanchae TaxID=1884249 RepID=UPI001108FE6F|nr:hypothetical protein [Spirosoma lacussanchae]